MLNLRSQLTYSLRVSSMKLSHLFSEILQPSTRPQLPRTQTSSVAKVCSAKEELQVVLKFFIECNAKLKQPLSFTMGFPEISLLI